MDAEHTLVKAARQGDDAAFATLSEQYRPLLRSMAEAYRHRCEPLGCDFEDLLQEASFSLYRAVMTYDTKQSKVSFGLYAKVCIRNRMVSVMRRLRSEKRRKLALQEQQKQITDRPPRRDTAELVALSEKLLANYERTVFLMFVEGHSYKDIANTLGVSVKSVDNAIFRAKKKLRKAFPLL